MFKKFIVPIILFLIGIAFYILGAIFKMLHWGYEFLNAPTLLVIAFVFQLLAIIVAISRLIQEYRHSK